MHRRTGYYEFPLTIKMMQALFIYLACFASVIVVHIITLEVTAQVLLCSQTQVRRYCSADTQNVNQHVRSSDVTNLSIKVSDDASHVRSGTGRKFRWRPE